VVQDRGEQQAHRLGEVQETPDLRVAHDFRGPPDVGRDHLGGLPVGQQGLPVDVHHRVVVHVHRADRRVDLVRDLVHVVRGGQARSEVQQLRQSRFAGQVPDHTAQERPVGPGDRGCVRRDPQHRLDDPPVGGEIVLAAEERVVDAGDVRRPGIDTRRRIPAKGAGTILSGHAASISDEEPAPRPGRNFILKIAWASCRKRRFLRNKSPAAGRVRTLMTDVQREEEKGPWYYAPDGDPAAGTDRFDGPSGR
jgi:hypothetical protein